MGSEQVSADREELLADQFNIRSGARLCLFCGENAMKCFVQTVLNCPAERVWETVQTSSLLLDVMKPVIRLEPVGGGSFPERWTEGMSVRCRVYLFGVLLPGLHTLELERIDQEGRQIQSREKDPLVRRWDHRIRVEAISGRRAHYSDEVDIKAGILTPVVWFFAAAFYRHRQRRWRRIARRLAHAA
jgi:hypothetical protein